MHMNKRIKHLLIDYNDSTRKIAAAYGCSGNAVWRELCGERISEALRRFISARWEIRYEEFMHLTQSRQPADPGGGAFRRHR